MSNSDLDQHKKDKTWLYSDIYDRPGPSVSPSPRTSVFQFGTFGDLVGNAGKFLGQSIFFYITFFLLGIPLIVFIVGIPLFFGLRNGVAIRHI